MSQLIIMISWVMFIQPLQTQPKQTSQQDTQKNRRQIPPTILSLHQRLKNIQIPQTKANRY